MIIIISHTIVMKCLAKCSVLLFVSIFSAELVRAGPSQSNSEGTRYEVPPVNPDCKCVTQQGVRCHGMFEQIGDTPFWIYKMTLRVKETSFLKVVAQCAHHDLIPAEILDEDDHNMLVKAAEEKNTTFWLGIVNDNKAPKQGWMYVDSGLPVTWRWKDSHPEEEDSVIVLENGMWKQCHFKKECEASVVCQFPSNSECYGRLKWRMKFDGQRDPQNCGEPVFRNHKLKKLGDNSKYLYLDQDLKLTAKENYNLCKYLRLEPASVRNFHEWESLRSKLFQDQNSKDLAFILGINDMDIEGQFRDSFGHQRSSFQAFKMHDFQLQEESDFVVIKHNKNADYSYMIAANDSTKNVRLLCEYRRGSMCHRSSNEGQWEINNKLEEMKQLGSAFDRVFFMSYKQKTWSLAMEFCRNQGGFLLDLPRNHEVIASIITLLKEHSEREYQKPFIFGFWTSGVYKPSFNAKEFVFETTKEKWTDMESESANRKVASLSDDAVTNPDTERCVALLATGEQADSKVVLKAVHCELPQFFVCYKDIGVVVY